MSQTGWEMIGQIKGRWYTINRTYGDESTRLALEQWIATNRRYDVSLRKVSEADPPLSGSLSPTGDDRELEDSDMPTREQTANADGYAMGNALYTVLGKPANPDVNAVFSLGRRFAEYSQYTDMKAGMEYVQGFVSAFREGKARQLLDEKMLDSNSTPE